MVQSTTPSRTRRTRAELRAMVVDAGCQVLLSLEPTLAFEQLTYGTVFQHLQESQGVRVTHASVHERIWPNQKAFQLEVLKTTLDTMPDMAFRAFTGPLEEALQRVDLTTLQGRRRAAQDLMRIGQNANWDAMVIGESNSLRIYQMLRIAMATFPADPIDVDREELMDLMVQLRGRSHQSYIGLIKGMCELIGLRPNSIYRDEDDAFEQLARAASATAVGFVLDELYPADEMFELPTGPNGELEPWRPVSAAVWNLMRGSFELSDDGLEEHERRL